MAHSNEVCKPRCHHGQSIRFKHAQNRLKWLRAAWSRTLKEFIGSCNQRCGARWRKRILLEEKEPTYVSAAIPEPHQIRRRRRHKEVRFHQWKRHHEEQCGSAHNGYQTWHQHRKWNFSKRAIERIVAQRRFYASEPLIDAIRRPEWERTVPIRLRRRIFHYRRHPLKPQKLSYEPPWWQRDRRRKIICFGSRKFSSREILVKAQSPELRWCREHFWLWSCQDGVL